MSLHVDSLWLAVVQNEDAEAAIRELNRSGLSVTRIASVGGFLRERPGVVQRVRSRLLDLMETQQWPVTISIGVVGFDDPPSTVDEMVRLADQAMYSAKDGGKNQILFRQAEASTPSN